MKRAAGDSGFFFGGRAKLANLKVARRVADDLQEARQADSA